MENTRIERAERARNTTNTRTRNYSSRDRNSNDNSYKKAIFVLQIMICVGLFTGALLIRTINNSFTGDIREKIKSALSENVSISELYNKATNKIKDVIAIKATKDATNQKTEEETKKKSETPTEKLVPTLED